MENQSADTKIPIYEFSQRNTQSITLPLIFSVEVDIKHAAAGAAEEGDDEAAQPREGHVRRRQARQQK